MQSIPQLLTSIWGSKRAKALVMEYRVGIGESPMLLADLAKICDVGVDTSAMTVKQTIEVGARQRVFAHIARMCQLKPEDFIAAVDARGVE